MSPNLLVYEIKFEEEINSLFFLINQTTATALPLWKSDRFWEDTRHLFFQIAPGDPYYGFCNLDGQPYAAHTESLLLAEISRQVGFKVTHFVYNYAQAREVFGHLLDEFMEAHKISIG
jgi:hypothetical protein